MRGEPNAVGIPTKKLPSMTEDAFFKRGWADFDSWCLVTQSDITKLQTFNGTIVWPENGIGTGLAELSIRAPVIWWAIKGLERSLK